MTEKINNLTLWNEVKTPDPQYTKQVKMRGGFTAIDAHYLFMVATDKLGAYGKGFGLMSSSFDYSMVPELRIAVHNAVFFYLMDGERHEFPITNSIEVVSKNGVVDSDYAKKAETNTTCKALSKIGFAADVYMGMFDDQDYVVGAAAKANMDKEEEREVAAKAEYDKLKEYVNTQIISTQSMSDPSQACKALERVKQKVVVRCTTASFGSKGFEALIENEKAKRNAK
jgi:hypothetical protein